MPIKISLRRIVYLLGIGLICTLINRPPAPAYSQSPQWAEPVMVSVDGGFAWFPNVTTDSTGGVHLFWASGREVPENRFGGYDTVIYCQPTPTGCPETFEVAALQQFAGEFNTRPAAVVDSLGDIHMLWRGETVIFHTSASVIPAPAARHWTSSRRVSGKNTSYYLNIAQDQRGVLHAVWSENMFQGDLEKCFGCSDIFYRQSTDLGQTWSAPIDLSNTDWASEKPQIVLGPNNTVYVAWEEGHDFYIGKGEPQSSMIIASRDGGLTWEKPTTFIFPGDTPQSIAAGVDGQGKLVAVWQQVVGLGIYYQVSTDQAQSWSAPKLIPGVVTRSIYNDLDDYDMAVDSAGHLHLVLVGRDAQAVAAAVNQPQSKQPLNNVYHLEWNGSGWSEPDPIFTSTNGDLPEWPRIAIANGNQLHIVWFNRDKAHIFSSEGGKYQIWYDHGLAAAPAVAPLAWPTPTPSPTPATATTPTVTPVPTTTPSPTPTLDPSLAQVSIPDGTTTSIYGDNDEVFLLAKSLLPAALIIVVVIVAVRFWRR